jgi:ubiquinone/menaquinone biosynthesis C-methylase UbiE
MVAGRRSISIHEPASWIYNRMAEVYGARPPHADALVEAIAEIAPRAGCRVGDLGAGTGHLSLALAERGFDVTAFEPAVRMLEALQEAAGARGCAVRAVHSAAETLPVPDGSLELVVIADALHFIDVELVGLELLRVLTRKAALAVVTLEPGDTAFMRGIVAAMEEAAPRRPRDMNAAVAQLFGTLRIPRLPPLVVEDETPVTAERLLDILRSISFIGPAMNAERFAAFSSRVLSLPGPRVWARSSTVHRGRRGQ